ncbi:MAG: DUF998 domain-containing protein [Candidatus Hodarchaeota archaeon]
MVKKAGDRMEVLFGFFGAIVSLTLLIMAAFLSPRYTPLNDAVSDLGVSKAKSLFSISFVLGGSLGIPFYIFLERELINIKESIRRLATGISILTCVCIALVGIIPDESYGTIFDLFHASVATVSFAGSSIYIVLYSILMYNGPKSKMYKGPAFKKYHAFFGFGIGIILLILTIMFLTRLPITPLLEWILTILMYIWILITALQLISYKFFNIPGVYYRRAQYPEALKLFEDAIQILNNLNLSDEPITQTLNENIEFLKKQLEKDT